MNARVRWSLKLVLAALAVLLAACGGNGGDTADSENTEGEQASAEGVQLAEEVDTGELYGIGVQKGNEALLEAINGQLEAIISDGTYQEIYSQWFEGDVPEQFRTAGGNAGGDQNGDVPEDLGLIEEGRLVVGSDIAFEPFEFVEDGENKGFDIDLMNEIAERLGVEVEFVNTPFDTIFTQLASGDFDAIISAITITEERQETIDFSEPYFAANQGLAVMAGSDVAGVEDLDGKQVAVQAGTTGLDYAKENFEPNGATIVEFPTAEAAFAALRGGQVDAVFIDLPVVAEQVEGGGEGSGEGETEG